MELEATGTSIEHFTLVKDNGSSREETLEMIVPDACPDIVQVVDTWGFCCLNRREVTDSGALLTGRVRVTILYIPEGDGGLQKLEAELPFQHLSECAQADGSFRLLARAWVASAETRVLNPRKVLIRADLREEVQLYRFQTLRVRNALDAADTLGLQTKTQPYLTTLVTQTAEKAFAMEEELDLTASRSASGVLLRVRPEADCREARLIGSKLVLKGVVQLQTLWMGERGLASGSFELPFSQMMDAAGVGEGAQCRVWVQVQSWQTGQISGDGRSMPISLELCAQAVFCESVPVVMMTDAYSTCYPTSLRTECWNVCQSSREEFRQPIREFVECGQDVQTVLDCHTELGLAQISKEGDQVTVTLPVCASVLCLDEREKPFAQAHSFSVSFQPVCTSEQQLRCERCFAQIEALPAAAGVELRGTVSMCIQTEQMTSAEVLTGLELDQEHPQEYAEQPSIVLRRSVSSEGLWEIAKRYSTTCQEICVANDLMEDQPLDGQMLLIPRKR
ncbi:MAG: hypothetical protein LIO45_04020 [Clostridiales bacterium]|nr:hypothetical protein [Clostridiales bacterium]